MEGQGVGIGRAHSFVGRQGELAELERLLDSGQRLITVMAPGGYGKSRLVQQLCIQLEDSYTAGTAQVLLAPLNDAQRIASHTAVALGLKLLGPGDALEQLCDYMREKKLLLHFDNFEHVIAGAPMLTALLDAAPQLAIIATSRETLHLPDEYVYPLDALPVETPADAALNHHYSPAVQLFADRAVDSCAQFFLDAENAPAVAEICTMLQGVPLAIELAAAWSGVYGLPELKRELKQQLDITARDASVPERHRSVRASCDWSYRLLNDEQQLVLRCLAAFKGGFFLEAGQYVIPATDLAADLESLTQKSWLYVRERLGQPRYYIHDAAIREYAYQQLLGAEDFEVAVRMHCSYYAALLEREALRLRSADQLAAIRQLALEQDNLYQALDTALKAEDGTQLLAFARHLHNYQLIIGQVRACYTMCGELATRAMELGQSEARQEALTGQARALLQLGRYEDARYITVQARALAIDSSDARGRAVCDLVLGEIERLEGNHLEARFRYTEALDTMRRLGAVHDIDDALHCLGRVEVTEGNYDMARTLIGESLVMRRLHGDVHGEASSLNDLANIEYRAGNYDLARQLNTQSLELRRRLGDRHGIAQSLHNLGNVEFGESNYPAAWTLYSESLEIKRDIGERFGIAASLNNLGNVEYCAGNYHDARRLHEQSIGIKRDIRDRMGIAYSLGNLGNISIKLREYNRAAAELHEGISTALELNSTESTLASLAVAASLFAALESYRVAGILYSGVTRMLPEAGLALDPMDGGMLEEAECTLRRELPLAAFEELGAVAAQLDMAGMADLALRELHACLGQDAVSGEC